MWSFGIVNGKLAEVFFETKRGKDKPYAHCYVNEKDYRSKMEKEWIKKDVKRVVLTFRNGKYTRNVASLRTQ